MLLVSIWYLSTGAILIAQRMTSYVDIELGNSVYQIQNDFCNVRVRNVRKKALEDFSLSNLGKQNLIR